MPARLLVRGHGPLLQGLVNAQRPKLNFGPLQKNICIHLRDAHGCANAAGAGCARAAQFAESYFFASILHQAFGSDGFPIFIVLLLNDFTHGVPVQITGAVEAAANHIV
jgi:hypothetical protein